MGIQLISREKAFEHNPALANAVIGWQQLEYADLKEELEPDDLRYFEKDIDDIRHVSSDISYSGEVTLASNGNTLDNLLSSFKNLLEKLKISELTFIPVYKKSWLYQKNNYKPLKNALKHINSIIVRKDYNEAILASDKDIEEMFASIFWIGRCNAAMCDIYFASPARNLVFWLCKRGGLHLYFYDKQDKEAFDDSLQGSGFDKVEKCNDIFNEIAIKGRKTI